MAPITQTDRMSTGLEKPAAVGGAGDVARSGSLAWLASSAFSRIAFAPEGIADIGGGDGGNGGGDGGEAGKNNDGGKGGGDGKAKEAAKPNGDEGKKVEKPVRPDWLPETIWDADKGFKKDDFDGLVALKAETDSRKASVPASADKYEIKLPQSFKLPDGFELKDGETLVNPEDPRVKAAQEWAHSQGKTQVEFEQLLEFGANMDIAERGRLKEAVTAEREKLGNRGVERIKAVTTWLDAKLGAEAAESLHAMMFTARQIEAFERLMQLNRGDVPGRPGASREAKPAEISDDDWSKMSVTERINHARQAAK